MTTCETALRELERYGVLVMQDRRMRSVVGILAGGPLHGSWWSHPSSHEMFQCLERIGDSPDVLTCRLLARKVTYIHRRHWSAFLSVATAGERWQTAGLSAAARALLSSVRKSGQQAAKGPPARELQERLLVAAEEVHTDKGRHELRLETWESWESSRGPIPRIALAEAKSVLEECAKAIGGGKSDLPWVSSRAS